MAAMESLIREREARLEIEQRQNSLSYEHRRVQRELLSATQKVEETKGQLAARDEEIKARNEQLRAENEQIRSDNEQMKAQIRTQDDKMSMILHALAMSGLHIEMPAPDLAPPSTSQPLRPADT